MCTVGPVRRAMVPVMVTIVATVPVVRDVGHEKGLFFHITGLRKFPEFF